MHWAFEKSDNKNVVQWAVGWNPQNKIENAKKEELKWATNEVKKPEAKPEVKKEWTPNLNLWTKPVEVKKTDVKPEVKKEEGKEDWKIPDWLHWAFNDSDSNRQTEVWKPTWTPINKDNTTNKEESKWSSNDVKDEWGTSAPMNWDTVKTTTVKTEAWNVKVPEWLQWAMWKWWEEAWSDDKKDDKPDQDKPKPNNWDLVL